MDSSSLRISRIVVNNPGKNYTTATATVETSESSGTPPTINPVLFSPIGENAVFELFATKVKLFATMVPDNTNNVDRILENDYRNISVWLNPKNRCRGIQTLEKLLMSLMLIKQIYQSLRKTRILIPAQFNRVTFYLAKPLTCLERFLKHQKFNLSATVTLEKLTGKYDYNETVALHQYLEGHFPILAVDFTANHFSDDATLSPSQNTYRLANRLDIETTSGASILNDGTVTGISGGQGSVVQFIEDVNSSPPTGTLLSDVSPIGD